MHKKIIIGLSIIIELICMLGLQANAADVENTISNNN